MARLYADEDFPLGSVQVLRGLGHDVLTVQEAGRQSCGDPQVLADATADGRAVLTHNHMHFRRLHLRCQPHPGVISCTHDDQDPVGLAHRIHAAITSLPDLTNQFIRVVRPNPAKAP